MGETFLRTPIAEFVLRTEGKPDRRVTPFSEPVELTLSQLDHYVAAGVVHRDDAYEAEAAAKASALKEAVASASAIDPNAPAQPSKENLAMRTESGEQAARDRDGLARTASAQVAQSESTKPVALPRVTSRETARVQTRAKK